MGETGATANDVAAAYWNPSGLNDMTGKSVTFMHAIWLEDISFQNAMYAQKTDNGAFAVGATYLSMSDIAKFDNTGVAQNDSYKPSDMAAWLSYARQIGEVPVGVSVKYISSQIDSHSATAVAADVGVMIKTVRLADRELRIGLAVQNLGTQMKFISESFGLPLNVKAGASYALTERLTGALDVNKPVDTDVIGNAGLQYLYPFGEKMFIAGRAGYRSNTNALNGLAGFTGGLGFGYYGIQIDYAFVPYGDLDDTHRISLTYNF
jgi:hypothetical protein